MKGVIHTALWREAYEESYQSTRYFYFSKADAELVSYIPTLERLRDGEHPILYLNLGRK